MIYNPFLSRAMVVGLLTLIISIVLIFFNPWFSIFPPVFYIIVYLAPLFFPRLGFSLQLIRQGHTGRNVVAITFDDGPDSDTTVPLLLLLKKHKLKATFFVMGRKVTKQGDLILKIIDNGHDIGNHSYEHNPLLMLRSSKKIFAEIELTQNVLKPFNIIPCAFRPPLGITHPKLGPILSKIGMYCVTFSCSGFDTGNRYISGLARRILKKIKPDDIIVLHDIKPRGRITVDQWLREMDFLFSGLKKKNLEVIPLHELIGSSVTKTLRVEA